MGIDQNNKIVEAAPILKFIFNTDKAENKYLKEIKSLYGIISDMKLQDRVELPETISKLTLMGKKPIEIEEESRKLLRLVAKELNINLTKDFFSLGNLSQSTFSPNIFCTPSYIGTDTEKEKYKAIQKLLSTISKMVEWCPVERAFADKQCIKLALQNSGTDIDEDIEICLHFSKRSLLLINEFPKFNNQTMGYLLDDCDMSKLFGICSTSAYSDYDSSIVTHQRFSHHISTASTFPGQTPDYNESYQNELDNVFFYSCFDEGEEYIIKLKIDYIKHHTTIAFPSIIFIKEPCKYIPYEITSKNSREIISGEIAIYEDVHNQ